MRNPKEQRKDVVRDAGSAFSTSETLVFDGVWDPAAEEVLREEI